MPEEKCFFCQMAGPKNHNIFLVIRSAKTENRWKHKNSCLELSQRKQNVLAISKCFLILKKHCLSKAFSKIPGNTLGLLFLRPVISFAIDHIYWHWKRTRFYVTGGQGGTNFYNLAAIF